MKRFISALLVLTMLIGLIPAFAVASSAADVSITVDGDLSDWADLKSVSIVGSGEYEGKTATWYGVLTDAGLYLACDAYHNIYITTAGNWWENTNFEAFVYGDQRTQYWVSAKNGGEAGNVTEWKLETEELTDAATAYHSVAEVFIANDKLPANAVKGDFARVSLMWKTNGDLCNNGGVDGNSDWWAAAHTHPDRDNGNHSTYVKKDGVYTVDEYKLTVDNFKSYGSALTGASAWGSWRTENGELIADGDYNLFVADDYMTSGKITATLDRSAKPDSHDGIVFGITGDDTYFWEGGSRYYFFYFEGNEARLVKTGSGLGWNELKRYDTNGMWNNNTITISVEYNEEGKINCYAGETLIFSVTDSDPLSGGRYGVRAKWKGVKWTSLEATPVYTEITTAFDNEVDLPIASWTGDADLTLKGYHTQGDIYAADGKGYDITDTTATSNSWKNIFVITNDKMPTTAAGSLSATFTGRGNASNENDNGIIFGLEATENVTLWENIHWTAPYYFMYVGDNNNLILAKVADGTNWQTLKVADGTIEGYSHGTEVSIKAEFEPVDGGLLIKGYANGKLLIEYTDADPLTGYRYGIRSEVNNVVYTSLVAEHEKYVEIEPSLVGDYYLEGYSGVEYTMNFNNGVLTIVDKVDDGVDISGTYTYEGTFETGISVYDANGELTGITISQMWGFPTFSPNAMSWGAPLTAGQPPVRPELKLGDNSFVIKVEGYVSEEIIATFTAEKAGKYTLSATEGAETAWVGTEGLYGIEAVEFPYEFELEEGETITFYISTSEDTNPATGGDGETEDEINLVITGEGDNAETGDNGVMIAVIALVAVLGMGITVVTTKRVSVR